MIPLGTNTLDPELLELEILIAEQSKGGPGSGNWGHGGRSGQEGGSVGRGRGSGIAVRDAKKKTQLRGTRQVTIKLPNDGLNSKWTMLTAVEEACKNYGFKDMDDMEQKIGDIMQLDMEGTRSSIRVVLLEPASAGAIGSIRISAAYSKVDADGKFEESIGDCVRKLMVHPSGGVVVDHDSLGFQKKYMSQNLGNSLYDRQISFYKQQGYREVWTYANSNIGRYAWARRGFQYNPGVKDERYEDQFKTWWRKKVGPEPPEGGWPRLRTPQDSANLSIPGIKIPDSKISAKDLMPGNYDVGKAFMLDTDEGHGTWHGVLSLQ